MLETNELLNDGTPRSGMLTERQILEPEYPRAKEFDDSNVQA